MKPFMVPKKPSFIKEKNTPSKFRLVPMKEPKFVTLISTLVSLFNQAKFLNVMATTSSSTTKSL